MASASPDRTLLQTLHAEPDLKDVIHSKESDPDYAKLTRPWNVRCSPKPLAVVVAQNAKQVSAAVTFASNHNLAVQPRSGGHSYASYSLGGTDGALVIDLSLMNDVKVHPEADPEALWRADIGGGTRLGRVAEELYRQGKRAIAHGTCPDVGIGGHATIGGQGPLSRLWGLCLDHVIQAEVVTADGSIKLVDSDHDSDLFWAIRGAGASFAIVTRFIVETHPAITETEYYSLQYTVGPSKTLSEAFQSWQSYLLEPSTQADRYFNSVCSFSAGSFVVRGSRLEGPGPHAERLSSMLDVHIGDHVEAKSHWKLDWVAHVDKWAQDEVFNFLGGKPTSQYLKSLTVRQDQPLTKAATDAMFDYFLKHKPGHGLIWFVLADFELGRIADHAITSTAYAHRDALYTLAAYVIDPIPGRTFPQAGMDFLNGWTRVLQDVMRCSTFGTYPGYVDPEIAAVESGHAYWGENYTRLCEIKQRYDPKNIFRNPQSVALPAATNVSDEDKSDCAVQDAAA